MMEDLIIVDYRDEMFVVGCLIDKPSPSGKAWAGVMREFAGDWTGLLDAVQYAQHVMDGAKLCRKAGLFRPTATEEVRLTDKAFERVHELLPVDEVKQ